MSYTEMIDLRKKFSIKDHKSFMWKAYSAFR